MDIKGNTKTYSTATQTGSFKPDTTQNLSVADREKILSGEGDVGELLNKVADPNWVDPAKTRRVGNSELDKDAFLKLMLAQMKNQDPTNPQPSHEMAAQLAQFTSLEQLSNINTVLESMKTSQAPTVNYQALNFIGKKVSGDFSKVTRVAGDTEHGFSFNLPVEASEANVKVVDSEGNVVKTYKLQNLKKGENAIRWNGMGEDGLPTRPGDYRFVTEAKTSSGTKIVVKTDFDGIISGLNYTPKGPVLMVGDQTIRLQDVKKIIDPGMSSSQSQQAPVIPLSTETKGEPKGIPAAEDAPVTSNLNKIAMSRSLKEDLDKKAN